MGYRIMAICSPHSYDLVRSYGADEVLDYHEGDPGVGEAIKRISGGGVINGFDTISEGASFKIILGGFKENAGGQLNVILPAPQETYEIRKDVKVVSTLMYTLFGKVGSVTGTTWTAHESCSARRPRRTDV
jgi:NADPH:quinone reductase-like Zn-dependent oxidoreductase